MHCYDAIYTQFKNRTNGYLMTEIKILSFGEGGSPREYFKLSITKMYFGFVDNENDILILSSLFTL